MTVNGDTSTFNDTVTIASGLTVTNGGIVAYNTQTDLDDISAVRNAIGSLVAEVTGSDSEGVATFGQLGQRLGGF